MTPNGILTNGAFGGIAEVGFGFYWLDVDDVGACGPTDDIVHFKTDSNPGSAGVIWRSSLDGTYSGEFFGDGARGDPPEGDYGGHYPWAFTFSKTQARCISMGLADTGVYGWRLRQSGDPDGSFDSVAWPSGNNKFAYGAIDTIMPLSLRPSFATLTGFSGTGYFGQNVVLGDDDIQGMTDAQLATFIQNGWNNCTVGGSIPRPEFSIDDGEVFPSTNGVFSRDLCDLIYFIRRNSLAGSYPTRALPDPTNLNFIRPIISGVSATRLRNTSIRVNWTTNVQTIGLIGAGLPYSQSVGWAAFYPYNLWSPLETGYGTSHTVTITGLPDVSVSGNGPTHDTVVSKDKAGNWARSPDATV